MEELNTISNEDTQPISSNSKLKAVKKKKFTFVHLSNRDKSNTVNASDTVPITCQKPAAAVRYDEALLPHPILPNDVPKRFATVTDEMIDAIKERRFDEQTNKSTKWG